MKEGISPELDSKDPFLPVEKALRRYAHRLNRPGFVAQAEGGGVRVVPWLYSARRADGALLPQQVPVPEKYQREMKETLPPTVRRTVQQRFEKLVDSLFREAVASYRLHGRVVWPKSIQNELRVMGVTMGEPANVDAIRKQVEQMARHYITKAGHQQADSDRSKVVLDWHGHYNHVLARSSSGGSSAPRLESPSSEGSK